MYSTATTHFMMDFLVMSVDDGVMDSPLNGGKHPNSVNLPSPLKCRLQSTSLWDRFVLNAMTQRKFYNEEIGVVESIKVCPRDRLIHIYINYAIQINHLFCCNLHVSWFVCVQAIDVVAKSVPICASSLRESTPTTCSFEWKPSTSNLSLLLLPQCTFVAIVARWECRIHDRQHCLHSIRRS